MRIRGRIATFFAACLLLLAAAPPAWAEATADAFSPEQLELRTDARFLLRSK